MVGAVQFEVQMIDAVLGLGGAAREEIQARQVEAERLAADFLHLRTVDHHDLPLLSA